MKGGVRWKEGADTCVFKPSVACAMKEDDGTPKLNASGAMIPNPNRPAAIKGMISRIVPSDSLDYKTETIIRNLLYFQDLIKLGYVSTYWSACPPIFNADDKNFGNNISSSEGPCGLLNDTALKYPEDFKNLITKEYDATLKDYIKSNSLNEHQTLELLRGAIIAAVTLVPDDGVWVVHGDLHYFNIYVASSGGGAVGAGAGASQIHSGIADWGRSIVFHSKRLHYDIEDKGIPSLLNALRKYLQIQADAFGASWTTYEEFLASLEDLSQETPPLIYDHLSFSVLGKINTLFDELGGMTDETEPSAEALEEGMAALRGWMVYAILKKYYLNYNLEIPDWLFSLLQTKNQQGLIDIVNTNLPKIHGEDYYNLPRIDISKYSKPKTTTGGRRRKTKKQKRKQKKQTRRI